MTDSTLNRFLAYGTNAARLAFTPSVPTPASGPSQAYFWYETDTGDTYCYAGGSWFKVDIGSGGGDCALLSTATAAGSSAVLSFTSISGSYQHLKIIGSGRSAKAGTGSDNCAATFNSDTGANYAYQIWYSSTGSSNQLGNNAQNSILLPQVITAGDVANYPTSFEMTIPNYKDTTFYKSLVAATQTFNGNTAGSMFIQNTAATWANTAAITRIDLTLPGGNWVAGSKFSLYGLK